MDARFKKATKVYGITAAMIVLIPILVFAYIPYQLASLEKATYEHLIDRQGYADSDILRIDTKVKFLSFYTTEVVFADEPDITYDYKKNAQGDIIHVGMSDPEGVDWKNYKHKHEEASP
ncbi:DUF3139 domain-containing protein [Paenibacillus dendritiformis]|uniref:DUF3139 domain-containing protein n=1 Tax=Paenibacillus dendritiformis TaxID=130049 RepID=UPI00248C90AF|nr:DUF3139 domain-containing protein [Paenibacillus dendritiformis]WGU92631.1 DUF3139 domain-containing protein [Paenibacillus dendritiformis]